MIRRTKNKGIGDFSNVDVVVAAVYELGGKVRFVETEDIAVLAEQLAPGRFSWRKYKDRTDLEQVRVVLFDARKPEKGGYLVGNKKDGWKLTDSGITWAESIAPTIGHIDLSRVVQTPEEKRLDQWLKRERGRMLGSGIAERYGREGKDSITNREAESFFKLDEYIKGESRKRKVERLIKAFSDDPVLGPAIKGLASKVLEK